MGVRRGGENGMKGLHRWMEEESDRQRKTKG